MARQKAPTLKLDLGTIGRIAEKEAAKEAEKKGKASQWNGEDGRILLCNILAARVANSYEPKRPALRNAPGGGGGFVDNEDFGKGETGWSAGAIYEDLPDDWKAAVTVEDVEDRLVAWWEEENGGPAETTTTGVPGGYVNEPTSVIKRSKVARYQLFTLNIPALLALAEKEAAEEDE